MRTPRPTLRRVAGGLAALALAASLTACGGGDAPEVADDPATDSFTSATPESPEPADAESPVAVDDGGQIPPEVFVEKIRKGVENTRYAHMKFVSGSASTAVEGEGDVDYTASPPNMKLTLTIAGQEQSTLLVDGVMYVGSPQTPGKFIKFDLNDPDNPLGGDFVDQMDPTSAMATFTEAVTSVLSAGEEEVDGQTADRYDVTIDTSKLGTELPPDMPAEVTASIWMDDRDRMVKTSIDLGSSSYEATLSDFDEVVKVTAPPADQMVASTR